MEIRTLKLFLENIGTIPYESGFVYLVDMDKLRNMEYGIATLSINPENFQTFTYIESRKIGQRKGIDYDGNVVNADFGKISSLMIGALEQLCMYQRSSND